MIGTTGAHLLKFHIEDWRRRIFGGNKMHYSRARRRLGWQKINWHNEFCLFKYIVSNVSSFTLLCFQVLWYNGKDKADVPASAQYRLSMAADPAVQRDSAGVF